METNAFYKRKILAVFHLYLPVFLMIIVASMGSLLMVWGFSRAQYEVKGLSIELQVEPSRNGSTEISLPPLGEIIAYTHPLPVTIRATLAHINLESLKLMADMSIDQEEFTQEVEEQFAIIIKDFIRRLFILAAVGGALGALLVYPKNLMSIVKGLIVGLLLISLLIGSFYLTFEPAAFRQPVFSGTLRAAPMVVHSLERGLSNVELFRREMRNTASNLYDFYSKIEAWEPVVLEEGTVRALHVSDIHNNIVAFDLIQKIIKDFKVSFVVDTGDVTDFGSPIETEMAAKIEKLGVPYLYVPGNHDSPASVEKLQEMSNVKVLDEEMGTIKGINIVGFADPAAHSLEVSSLSDKEMRVISFDIAKKLKSFEETSFIVALHDERMSKQIIGKAPVILFGHTHKASLKQVGNSVLINAGTTGAAGLRTFEIEKGVPYTFHLLYIRKEPLSLIAVDSVEVMGLEREFTLKRTLIEESKEKE
ncbi:metallophosphoesterase [Candidatus Oleimmundimicrobium sp.]|uniref:metallophosphoesterase family protein n=1 Tax=Candidatus Oleimmundimicrobium sp. TaxID=3060597 RepID=UPI002717DADE|nr:metallophosphoesterase [Candidatus Oleimmundimicrobium sp.]MDO8886849.1 metallophosphoesterase family protein [Candidatus Oleimmundimicrobium sp.]